MAKQATSIVQASLPDARWGLTGRRMALPCFPEDRVVESTTVCGHTVEIWHLGRLDWYEVRVDGNQRHVSGACLVSARVWRDHLIGGR